MLFDEIKKRYEELKKIETQKNNDNDYADLQYGDGGIEVTISKNNKTIDIKEQ